MPEFNTGKVEFKIGSRKFFNRKVYTEIKYKRQSNKLKGFYFHLY